MSRTLVPLFAAFVLVSSFLAAAGTRTDPEVSDGTGDTIDTTTGLPLNAPAVDLVSAWFVETTGSEYEVHVRVADLSPPTVGQSQLWRVRWTLDGEVMGVDAERFFDGGRANFEVRDSPGTGYPTTADGSAVLVFDDMNDEITTILPRAFNVDLASGGIRSFAFEDGTTFADPEALAFQGQGSLGGITVNSQVDDAGPGQDFEFSTSIPPVSSDSVWTGKSPGNHVYATSIKFNGVEAGTQKGNGALATVEITIADDTIDHRKITFGGETHTFAAGTVVTIQGFEGAWDAKATNMNVKLIGTADSWSSS